ncbi:adenylate/guanylate cyclase domain-containing protein [Solimonas sp. SE-A11]|uniref:adenylate/guanylate cyclase domain-containing protein n=1 Tax=Solimonas sp. SE-A11 TaxID=3054954 RepID=UPI00259CC68E|nr:adenylate/guanylate cyclase domain-containing protein [Solimonas sp. SE-A11]MDM4772028.1 adenylate/guanylate cyclase domain-containing protein [Solimonas sp. SE-A11]
MSSVHTAYLVVGIIAAGMGVIVLMSDPRSGASRALAIAMLLLGLRLGLSLFEHAGSTAWQIQAAVLARLLEAANILVGIEWARRIAVLSAAKLQRTIQGLFRVSQLLGLVYGAMTLGYIAIAPEAALQDQPGVMRLSGLEWAVFTPVLGSSILLSGIAIVILMVVSADPAECGRLRALVISAPFLLGGLVLAERYVPVSIALGLLVFLGGSVRYYIVQAQRGEFMRQFLSPQVARVVNLQGMGQVMRRERRQISVVVCDLRGFTRFAAERVSDEVMDLLQRFYQLAGEVAAKHGGTVKDHAGDGLLVLVGAPLPVEDHARAAVSLALELMREAQPLLRREGELGLGIGIATGHLTVGAIQGAGRLEYVAVGNAVNLAARLCQRAEAGEVLCDRRTREALQDQPEFPALAREPEQFKGFDAPTPVYALSGA